MKTQHNECSHDRIAEFLAGRLPDPQVTQLELHLETCSQCDEELTRQTAEASFWNDAKSFLSTVSPVFQDIDTPAMTQWHHSELDEDFACDVIADPNEAGTLSFLDPTDDPRMLGRFGGYEISGIIGTGGMGVVMKGWDVSLDRFVAIKVLHANYAGQSASRKRFAREAQAAAAVVHDNVIAIYGVDDWKGMPYLVMPYIKGESLQQRIDRAAPLSFDDILGISLQITRGLAAAHDQGLVHRDIKPANILMPSSVSRVIITDFGLARTADDASLTRSGVLAGTPQYMSPEQATSDAIDGRTDLFSLGSVMYAMATGRPPFRAQSPYAILRKITDEPHRPLSQVREETPAWFEAIVDRLLEKNGDDRFQSAHELADHLEDCLAHLRQPTTTALPPLSPTTSSRLESRKPKNDWKWPAAIGLLSVFAVMGLFLADRLRNAGTETQANPSRSVEEPAATDQQPLDQSETFPSDDLPHMKWEFDDSSLDRLETDLRILLEETRVEPL